MRKKYRISCRNAKRDNRRELLYEVYTSRKKAQETCDRINAAVPGAEAYVIEKY